MKCYLICRCNAIPYYSHSLMNVGFVQDHILSFMMLNFCFQYEVLLKLNSCSLLQAIRFLNINYSFESILQLWLFFLLLDMAVLHFWQWKFWPIHSLLKLRLSTLNVGKLWKVSKLNLQTLFILFHFVPLKSWFLCIWIFITFILVDVVFTRLIS